MQCCSTLTLALGQGKPLATSIALGTLADPHPLVLYLFTYSVKLKLPNMDRIDFGKVTGDIGFRMTAAATGTFLAAAAVIVPNDTQKKAAALQMYDKPWGSLEPTERKAAEYAAGLKR